MSFSLISLFNTFYSFIRTWLFMTRKFFLFFSLSAFLSTPPPSIFAEELCQILSGENGRGKVSNILLIPVLLHPDIHSKYKFYISSDTLLMVYSYLLYILCTPPWYPLQISPNLITLLLLIMILYFQLKHFATDLSIRSIFSQ